MMKKMMLLAMAVGALVAFAVPAAASATPLVHDEKEEGVESVSAVSTNTISTTTAGTLQCQTVTLAINLSVNNTETATGSGTGTATGTPPSHTGHCISSVFGPTAITRVTVNHIHLTALGGTARFEFEFEPTAVPVKCTLEGNAGISYNTPTSLHIEGPLTPLTAGCPSGSIAGDFSLLEGVTVG